MTEVEEGGGEWRVMCTCMHGGGESKWRGRGRVIEGTRKEWGEVGNEVPQKCTGEKKE